MLIPDVDYEVWRITTLQVQRELLEHGHGARLLTALTRWADDTHRRLTMFADPIGDDGPNLSGLIRWYKKHGFEHVRGKTRNPMLCLPQEHHLDAGEEDTPAAPPRRNTANRTAPSKLEQPTFL